MLDYAAVDEWCKVTDEESFYFARKLIREEGLLVGKHVIACPVHEASIVGVSLHTLAVQCSCITSDVVASAKTMG